MAGQVLISSVDSAANALPGRAAPPGLVNVIHRLASDRPLSSACFDLVLDQSMAIIRIGRANGSKRFAENRPLQF